MGELPYEEKDGVLVFKPGEYLELDFKQALEDFTRERLTGNEQALLFNLEDVKLINSHGASAILALFKHLQTQNGTLAFCCLNELMVKETFRDTGIYWLCEKHIYKNEADALNALNGL